MFLFYVVFPYVIPWLASLQKRIRNLSVAIEILFYMQLIIFFSIVDFGILYLNNFDFAYWTARSFPPSRLPVFMMGCVLALRSLYGNENDSVRIYFTCCCKTSMKRMKRYKPSDNIATNPESSTPENLIAAAAADRLSAALLLTLLIAIIICATTKIVQFIFFRVLFEPIFPLFFAQLMVDLTNAGRMNGIVNKICRSKFGQFIGRISMSLYILHMIIFTACAGLIFLAPIIILVLIFAFAVLIAYGVTVYIEDPCRRCIRGDTKNQLSASQQQQQQHVATNNAGLNGVQMTVVQPNHHHQQQQQSSNVVYPVTIPDGFLPGMQMQVQLTNGQTRIIVVPQGAVPGTVIHIT
jgi:peptidoglycan/LPS O-acetylase OafA/YrhL